MDKECFLEDIDTLSAYIEKDFHLPFGHLSSFIEFKEENTQDFFYSLLLLAIFRFLSKERKPPYHMAAVIHFIKMAVSVHKSKYDSPEYYVLVGDYLYTHFLTYLCKYDSLDWLKKISNVICGIHQGGIERIQCNNVGENVGVEVLKKEAALLSTISCEIGATMAVGAEKTIQVSKDLGYNLGMARALILENAEQKEAQIYLEKAKEKLGSLKQYTVNIDAFNSFTEILNYIVNNKVVNNSYCKVV